MKGETILGIAVIILLCQTLHFEFHCFTLWILGTMNDDKKKKAKIIYSACNDFVINEIYLFLRNNSSWQQQPNLKFYGG